MSLAPKASESDANDRDKKRLFMCWSVMRVFVSDNLRDPGCLVYIWHKLSASGNRFLERHTSDKLLAMIEIGNEVQ